MCVVCGSSDVLNPDPPTGWSLLSQLPGLNVGGGINSVSIWFLIRASDPSPIVLSILGAAGGSDDTIACVGTFPGDDWLHAPGQAGSDANPIIFLPNSDPVLPDVEWIAPTAKRLGAGFYMSGRDVPGGLPPNNQTITVGAGDIDQSPLSWVPLDVNGASLKMYMFAVEAVADLTVVHVGDAISTERRVLSISTALVGVGWINGLVQLGSPVASGWQ